MYEESEHGPNFELDPEEFTYSFEICWICKNRTICPMNWDCETIENMDNDNTENGVDEA